MVLTFVLPPTTWGHSFLPTCCWVRPRNSASISYIVYCGDDSSCHDTLTARLSYLLSPRLCFISDLMKRSSPARIVTVSSVNHKKGRVDFAHFHGENLTYYMDHVYNHTKLHNTICTNELARRLQGTGMMNSAP